MWQRFTERARKVVFHAQEEAQRLGEGYIAREHLLLGLTCETDSVAVRVLLASGISLETVREELLKQLPVKERHGGQDMTLTPQAKRVIDLAYDESRKLGNNYIGTEHLLLGLIREGGGLTGRVFVKLGVDLEKARLEVMTLQESGRDPGADRRDPALVQLAAKIASRFGLRFGGQDLVAPDAVPSKDNDQIWESCTPRARAIIDAARERALARGASGIGAEHLLLALLADPECRGMRAIQGLNPDLPRIQSAAEALAAIPSTNPVPDPIPFSPSGQTAISAADVAAAGMENPFLGTEHLALVLFGGAAGEFIDPEILAPQNVRRAVAQSQAEE